MLTSIITRIVSFCTGRPWQVIILALLLALGTGAYAAKRFAIHTDIDDLISPDLPWSQRAQQYTKRFPQRDILVVLDAPTPELVDRAAAKLTTALRDRRDRFTTVNQPGGGRFFEQNGLVFLSPDELKRVTSGLTRANDLL